MIETDTVLAKKSYEIINSKASSNITIQGVSGVLSFPFTLWADGAVISNHYGTMLNEIIPCNQMAYSSGISEGKGINKLVNCCNIEKKTRKE